VLYDKIRANRRPVRATASIQRWGGSFGRSQSGSQTNRYGRLASSTATDYAILVCTVLKSYCRVQFRRVDLGNCLFLHIALVIDTDTNTDITVSLFAMSTILAGYGLISTICRHYDSLTVWVHEVQVEIVPLRLICWVARSSSFCLP
jgi:hypothetical protein